MTKTTAAANWNGEYRNGGIPSSVRDEASTTVAWALSNWFYLTGHTGPSVAVDVGCGTGRNAVYLASQGARVMAFDFSAEAVSRARGRLTAVPQAQIQVTEHNLADGLPVADGSADLVCDIFVYKHQMDTSLRKQYRYDVNRALARGGKFLLALAEIRDGYYASCPRYPDIDTLDPLAVVDPKVGAGSVLFTLESLRAEMSDVFELAMSWLKIKSGEMHGATYMRYTLATIWEARA